MPVPPGSEVLDVGAGTGKLTRLLAQPPSRHRARAWRVAGAARPHRRRARPADVPAALDHDRLLDAARRLTADAPAGASDGIDDHSPNMHLLGNVPRTTAVSQSDLVFWGRLAFAGNYNGFRVIDISDPEQPVELADVRCRGEQGDVSVWGNLLFVSVDRPTTTGDCTAVDTPPGVTGFEGIRIFDVGNPSSPQFVTAVPTDCGSHTHTLVPDLANGRVLLYVSSYPASFLGPTPFGTNCARLNEDESQGHSKISIVAVPLAAPQAAEVVAQPTFELTDFRDTPGFRGCHDISVFLELRLAAAPSISGTRRRSPGTAGSSSSATSSPAAQGPAARIRTT